MSLQSTNLVVASAPLPPNFSGSLDQFYAAMVSRLKILSPSGTQFFVVGDVEPASNQGPWLKGGTKWYVWNPTTSRYVPADVSDSQQLFVVSDAQPSTSVTPIWLRTVSNIAVGWYGWDGTAWTAFGTVVASGSTANRPPTPLDFQQYYDSDISTLIWWERGAWRTVSGVKDDVKHVTTPKLLDALAKNPGWDLFGRNDVSQRGQTISMACKDPGGSPDSVYTAPGGVTQRAALDVFGEELHVLTAEELPPHFHPIGRSITATDDIFVFRTKANGSGGQAQYPLPIPDYSTQIRASSASTQDINANVAQPGGGEMLLTASQLIDSSTFTNAGLTGPGHNTFQPTIALWTLVKM